LNTTPTTTALANSSLWAKGWYQFAKRIDSPHFSPRPPGAKIDLVVVHSISLPPGVYSGDSVTHFLTGQAQTIEHPYLESIKELKVSAHFFIRRQGELIQMVSCDDMAWHAGVSHYRGRDRCNDDSIGIELEGLEGDTFEAEQYETLCGLCSSLLQHYPIEHLAGHEHIAPARKKDPGAGFLWEDFRKSLGLTQDYFPIFDK
jgi:N-acetyl-anhydromuramoyl-L-alanine amidase